jgi:hypothetical protein
MIYTVFLQFFFKPVLRNKIDPMPLNYAVMGLQNQEHITLSYPETAQSSSNKWGLGGKREKSS